MIEGLDEWDIPRLSRHSIYGNECLPLREGGYDRLDHRDLPPIVDDVEAKALCLLVGNCVEDVLQRLALGQPLHLSDKSVFREGPVDYVRRTEGLEQLGMLEASGGDDGRETREARKLEGW